MRFIKKSKSIWIVVSFLLFNLILSGCYDRKELDEMAYVMGIGLDKGKTPNSLTMTLQIAVPKTMGSDAGDDSGGGNGGGKNSATTITTLEASSIYSGINLVNDYESKQISLFHVQVIVFSEDLAREGIDKYLHTFVRGKEFRGSMFVVVAKGTAEEYLRSVNPLLEINPSKFYRMEYKAFRYTGFTADTTLFDFHLKSECYCGQATATLASVNKFENIKDIKNKVLEDDIEAQERTLEGGYVAGEIPRLGENKAEIMGLAVFDGGKMVGELNGAEASYLLMVTGKNKQFSLTISDPLFDDCFIILDIRKRRNPQVKINIQEERPQADIKIDLEADILSIQSGFNYEDPRNTNIIEKHVEEYLSEKIFLFLKKTAEEFNTDICSLGEKVRPKFLTWDKWVDFSWLDRYKDTEFSVEVSLKIRRPGLMVQTGQFIATKKDGEI